MRRILIVLGLLTLNGATCYSPLNESGDPSNTGALPEREAVLRTFGSADELRNYFADQAIARIAARESGGNGFGCAPALPGAALDADSRNDSALPPEPSNTSGSTSGDAAGGGDPFSGTNVQEAGVDESDAVKTDGTYIYQLKGDTVRVVKAVPPDALEQVASIDLPQTADSLYLRGDKLIALSHSWGYWGDVWLMAAEKTVTIAAEDGASAPDAPNPDDPSSSPPSVIAPAPAVADDTVVAPYPGGASVSQTTVTVINIANPAAPTNVATLKFDGDLVSSRLIQNRLHLVLTATPPLPTDPTPNAIRAQPLDAWLPNYEVVAADGTPQTGKTIGWENFYYPANPDGYGITMVITVDVDNPNGQFDPVAISADAGTVYASTSALYVTDTNYDYTRFSYREDTAVHKFDLTGDAARYVASGLVPGRLLNQYSLGEKDGYLRLASTVQNFDFSGPIIMPTPAVDGAGGGVSGGSGTASSGSVAGVAQAAPTQPQYGNAVYVMHEGSTAGSLEIVGRLEGIAPGEQLYSARFVGDRGFLVTFVKIDPLFTVDLSDPTNPKLAGELKIPGYSEYIHLMDENHLLTIGKDAVDAGSMGNFSWYQGVLLSIFDVSDFANPTLLHKEVIGVRGTDSEALRNPKAFNYFAAKDALAIPIDLYEGQTTGPEYGRHTFTGLYVYSVTVEGGFGLLGRISTQDVADSPWDMPYWYGYAQYTRGVFIGDNVYAVTDRVVKAAPIAMPSDLTGTLTLPE